MNGKTHKMRRRLSVVALAASLAAVAVPAASAGGKYFGPGSNTVEKHGPYGVYWVPMHRVLGPGLTTVEKRGPYGAYWVRKVPRQPGTEHITSFSLSQRFVKGVGSMAQAQQKPAVLYVLGLTLQERLVRRGHHLADPGSAGRGIPSERRCRPGDRVARCARSRRLGEARRGRARLRRRVVDRLPFGIERRQVLDRRDDPKRGLRLRLV